MKLPFFYKGMKPAASVLQENHTREETGKSSLVTWKPELKRHKAAFQAPDTLIEVELYLWYLQD